MGGAVALSDAIDAFLAAVDDRLVRDRRGQPYDRRTARDLRWCLAGHVREALGAKAIDAVRRGDVEALLAELADEGVSERRCRAVARAVRALYDDAVARGLAVRNPASGVAVAADGADAPAVGSQRWVGPSERAISLVLRGATVGCLVLALVFLTESL
jgi:site-specific recombinase XerC